MTTPDARIVEDKSGSYLCFEQIRQEVDADEFRAWAAYSGIEIQPLLDGLGLQVVLRDEAQSLLLQAEWLS
jgi:hypothetical protein